MERKFKGLIAINDVLDDRYQKLSDKYHNLELSHNRKKKALNVILNFCESEYGRGLISPGVRISITQICNGALFSDGRERCREVKKKKITMRDVKAKCGKRKSISKGSKKSASSSNRKK